MSKSGAEVQAQQGSSCWRHQEGQARLCADTAYDPASAPAVEVEATDVLSARWDRQDGPKTVRAHIRGLSDERFVRDSTCEGGNPCRMALSLPPGEYFLGLMSIWPEGDVSHQVRLVVR